MKPIPILCATILSCTALIAQNNFQTGIQSTTLSEASNHFVEPPSEYASHVIWGWEGPMDIETIRHDLDSIKAKGFRSVIFEAGYHLPYEYLSDEWFESIHTGVMEAKARGLKVWIIDEGKYPSGFAGGKFTRERPDLRMKALVVKDTLHVGKADILKDVEVPSGVFSAVAVSRSGALDRTVEIREGKINFTAGLDEWDILLVGSDYRTGQTRAVNNPSGGKDTRNSICDYLSPEAVRQFIDWTHERYKQYIGDEFGKTVLGFRGDEPDFAYTPWTPSMVEDFIARKGYDPTPWFASLLSRNQTIAGKRFRADFWDVWSDLFAVNFFQQQADWCAEHNLAYITHLNNDHNMPVCIRAGGNFFRNLSKVQVPGVDAIWNQIWPETVNDFPKFASSVSHIYGKTRAFSESFAAYYTSPTIPQAKYVVDYQVVRGINFFEFMFWMAGSKNPNWMTDPKMKELNDYTNRTTYLMSLGKPGARIAVYYPTSTFWLANSSINPDLVQIAEILLQHQKDFDWIDDDAFTEALDVGAGFFSNRSGQKYSTLIIPSCDVVSKNALTKIQEYICRGGKVLFWGRKPTMVADITFIAPEPFPDMPRCFEEPLVGWSPTVEAAMPRSEFSMIQTRLKPDETVQIPATNLIRYTRRTMPDGDLYFLFNEGEEVCTFTADFDQTGIVQMWDAVTGKITLVPSSEYSHEGGKDLTRMTLTLKPWESRIYSIGHGTKMYNAKQFGVKGRGDVETETIQALIDKVYAEGGGTVYLPAGRYLSGALFFPRGVNLKLAKKAFLQGTANPEDYPVIPTRFEGIERRWKCAFLNFDHSDGVRVYGEGTLDGNGLEWKSIPFGTSGRPRLINFTNCNGGSLSGLRLQNQASWCVHVLYTQGFTIDGLDIRAIDYIPSSDGLDIDSSSDVHITGTYISVHDDCISIKSGKDEDGRRVARPSENILIENCHFAYGHGAVTMGSEISGDIRNVTIRNCVVDGDNWGSIRFKSQPARGGVVEDITFENIRISNVRNIFDINMEWMAGRIGEKDIRYVEPLTRLRNIVIRNVTGSGQSLGIMHGYADAPFGNDVFHFENCHFETETGLKISNAGGVDFNGMDIQVKEGEKFIHSTNR
jgi:hypothetical protein